MIDVTKRLEINFPTILAAIKYASIVLETSYLVIIGDFEAIERVLRYGITFSLTFYFILSATRSVLLKLRISINTFIANHGFETLFRAKSHVSRT